MTKSWWSGEPGEQIIDALNPNEDPSEASEDDASRLPITWWTVAIAVLVIAAIAGVGIYLLADTAHSCKSATEACISNR